MQTRQSLTLLTHVLDQLLAVARVAERFGLAFLLRLSGFGQALRQVLLSLIELASGFAHLPHLVVEAAGRAAAEFVAEVFEILLRARAGSGGLCHALLIEGLGGPLGLVAGLLKLIALRRHPLQVFGRFHAGLQLLRVLQHLPLLVLQPL